MQVQSANIFTNSNPSTSGLIGNSNPQGANLNAIQSQFPFNPLTTASFSNNQRYVLVCEDKLFLLEIFIYRDFIGGLLSYDKLNYICIFSLRVLHHILEKSAEK